MVGLLYQGLTGLYITSVGCFRVVTRAELSDQGSDWVGLKSACTHQGVGRSAQVSVLCTYECGYAQVYKSDSAYTLGHYLFFHGFALVFYTCVE